MNRKWCAPKIDNNGIHLSSCLWLLVYTLVRVFKPRLPGIMEEKIPDWTMRRQTHTHTHNAVFLIPFLLTCTHWNSYSSYTFLPLPSSLCHRCGRLWICMEAAAEGRGIGHGPQPHTHMHTQTLCTFVFVNVPVPLSAHFPPAQLHVCAWILSDMTIQYFGCICVRGTLIYYSTHFAPPPPPFWYSFVFTAETPNQIS